jgi:hypothetical protein
VNSFLDEPLDMSMAIALLAVSIYGTHARVFGLPISEGKVKEDLPAQLDELVYRCIHLLTQIAAGTTSGKN